MVGVELVAGYLFAWLAGKARRAGQRADGQVDAVVDAGVDRFGAKLHELVAGKLSGDRGLARLEREVGEGRAEPSADTRAWVALAVKDAAQADLAFDRELTDLLAQLQAAHGTQGGVSAGSGGMAVGGSQTSHAQDHSIAAGVINLSGQAGNPPVPGTP